VLLLLDALEKAPGVSALEVSKLIERMRLAAQRAFEDEERRRANAEDPFLATVWDYEEVFLDREDLRKSLRSLYGTEGGRCSDRHELSEKLKLVLQVVGEPESGKSYSWQLIRRLSDPCGFYAVPVILDETGTPDDVIQTLAMQVASTMETPPDRGADAAKWYGRASDWIVTKAKERGGQWWFVLDGLNHLPRTSEVWDLVGKLAKSVDLYGERRVRLILLGHDGTLDWSLRNKLLTDSVGRLEQVDLQEFFIDWFSAKKSLDRVALEAKVSDTVDQVLAFAATKDSYMRGITEAVEGVVREFSPSREDPDVPLGTFASHGE
jgi:hypothetical protein